MVDIHHNDLQEEGNPWLANPNIKIRSDFYCRICSGPGLVGRPNYYWDLAWDYDARPTAPNYNNYYRENIFSL